MKLREQLIWGSEPLPLESTYTRLELSAVGRAIYYVRSKNKLKQGLIQFNSGTGTGDLDPVFLGTIEICQEVDAGIWKLICREIANNLELPARLALRHITAPELLAELEIITGIGIVIPKDKDSLTRRTAYFYNLSTCRAALDAALILWGVDKPIWTQLPNGQIYWGSWVDSPFSSMKPVTIPEKLITNRYPEDRSFQIPTISALRPGMKIQNGLMVESLEISGEVTTVRWLQL